MTKQYNVNIVGNLTNDNGVLSGFSLNDYATLPETLENLTINSLEIVFKFKLTDNSGEEMLFCTDSASEPVIGGLRLYSDNTSYSYGLEVTSNGHQIGYIESEGNLLVLNTYYFIKATYSNSSGYSLYKSEDGETYTLIGTIPNTTMPSNPLGLIGTYSPWNSYLHGAIDLNKSYIKVNGAIWWRGVENITRIQLRHDTAANWTSVNPVLLEGEVGIETDTRKQKFGDGVTAWNSLPYDAGSTALQSITSSNVTDALGYTPVNKAGDIMSGTLTFDSGVVTIRHDTITRDGTNPSASSYKALNFVDKTSNNKRLGVIQNAIYTNGGVETGVYAFKNQTTDASERISIGYNNSGTAYTYAPSYEGNNGIVTTVSKSKSQNGYYKLGNGLIIQWGTNSVAYGSNTINLPTAFTSTNYIALAIPANITNGYGVTGRATTSFTFNATASTTIDWVAVGY